MKNNLEEKAETQKVNFLQNVLFATSPNQPCEQ
jgi:hypothetical protein